jgi:hypothetical protein
MRKVIQQKFRQLTTQIANSVLTKKQRSHAIGFGKILMEGVQTRDFLSQYSHFCLIEQKAVSASRQSEVETSPHSCSIRRHKETLQEKQPVN